MSTDKYRNAKCPQINIEKQNADSKMSTNTNLDNQNVDKY